MAVQKTAMHDIIHNCVACRAMLMQWPGAVVPAIPCCYSAAAHLLSWKAGSVCCRGIG